MELKKSIVFLKICSNESTFLTVKITFHLLIVSTEVLDAKLNFETVKLLINIKKNEIQYNYTQIKTAIRTNIISFI